MSIEQKTPEQQRYIRLCAQSKRVFQAQEDLDNLQESLASANDATAMLQLGYRLHQTTQLVRDIANSLYQEKMAIEKEHPEYKAEALAYGSKLKEQKAQLQNTQSF